MCGVIGLLYERPHAGLGRVASDLLRTLEYRGYDSTGGAIQGEGLDVDLRKGVGAPSVLVESLGIVRMAGQVFCGQVRWATFGAVTAANAQPHVVRCKRYLYGAHNGNVTNSDQLKTWLQDEGHTVLSDNDGEMVVHTIEHLFALGMDAAAAHLAADKRDGIENDPVVRRATMRQAIARASELRLLGSYAAVICDPVTRTLWAVKRGSSLYIGVGEDEAGRFGVASSDLSSVLKMTRMVVPIVEGEFVEMRVAPLADGQTGAADDGVVVQTFGIRRNGDDAVAVALERAPKRSRLRSADIALLPPYQTFMEQEIAAQEGTVRDVVALFDGGSADALALAPTMAGLASAKVEALANEWDSLRDEIDPLRVRARLDVLKHDPTLRDMAAALPKREERVGRDGAADELHTLANADGAATTIVLDALSERLDAVQWNAAADEIVARAAATQAAGGAIHIICCGSSYHAARGGALFWNALAGVPLVCSLPGEFRGEQAGSLRDGDLVIAISQSGETKDLIDILNDIILSGAKIGRVALVNNINSTLAQEKAEVVLPLRCGPEIAVPATKSYMNQLAVLYGLGLRLGRHLGRDAEMLDAAQARFEALPALIHATVTVTAEPVEEAARLLYLRSSTHILATRMWAVAKEGALKIREVVLNHTEGFEASEFKHGPNTILGRNTIYGPEQVGALLRGLSARYETMMEQAEAQGLSMAERTALGRATMEALIQPNGDLGLTREAGEIFRAHVDREGLVASLDVDYPLIYVSGPDARDIALTISQINTHKIRGSLSVMIAEQDAALRGAIEKPPADNPRYRSVYIELPRTGDSLMAVFSATVVLQRLALRMSQLKAAWLDRMRVPDHGVHPDVPKNVSKSITVD